MVALAGTIRRERFSCCRRVRQSSISLQNSPHYKPTTRSITNEYHRPRANPSFHRTCAESRAGSVNSNVRRRRTEQIVRFALINGERAEAQPLGSGVCRACGMPMVARCGSQRVWHWAHKGRLSCDPWWENETEWHRAWKSHFPEEWQEVVHHASDGERHIADVKTWDGWTLEFQHSAILVEERQSRECYYEALIWVVDGLRRKKDARQFLAAWGGGQGTLDPLSSKRRVLAPSGALLRDWSGSRAHVFFDFGEETRLWWLYPGSDEARAYVQDISREVFVRILREKATHGPTKFDERVDNFRAFIAAFESPPDTPTPIRRIAAVSGVTCIMPIRRGFRL